MVAKTSEGCTAPDGSKYVTLTDGAGNLVSTDTITPGSTAIASGTDQTVLFNDGNFVNGVANFKYNKSGNGALTLTDGTLVSRYLVSDKTASPYTVLTTDTNTAFTNSGASGEVNFNLPTAAAGLNYKFIVMTAQNLRVTATGAATISLNNTTSAANGNVVNNTPFGTIELLATSSSKWVVLNNEGTWTVT